MKDSHRKKVANYLDLESCVASQRGCYCKQLSHYAEALSWWNNYGLSSVGKRHEASFRVLGKIDDAVTPGR